MKVKWDYTNLADAYLKRPDYSIEAVHNMLKEAGIVAGDKVCDVGAGAAHLTKILAEYGCVVDAVEPNDAMRSNGITITEKFPEVKWHEGVGEATGMSSDTYKLVTFGSSFNVTDRQLALKETKRLLVPGGYFACMWNHRDLEDPIQKEIETIIGNNVDDYNYGTRREDQTEIINQSGLFEEVIKIEGLVQHEQSVKDCIEGWRSHATLYRQAGDNFDLIISQISDYLNALGVESIHIPYKTNIWCAKAKI